MQLEFGLVVFSAYLLSSTLTAPSAPRNVTVTSLKPTSLDLKWLRPAVENGIILSYTVFYTTQGMSFSKTVSFPEAELEGLSPYQMVEITVTAHTSAGVGPNSTAILIRTAEGSKLERCENF